MSYQKLNLQPGDVLTKARIDHIETQFDRAVGDLLPQVAKANAAIFKLEAAVLAAREGMAGWQGEGFYAGASVVNGNPGVGLRITRGNTEASGYAEGIFGQGWSDNGWTVVPSAGYPPVDFSGADWFPGGKYIAMGPANIYKFENEAFVTCNVVGTNLPNYAGFDTATTLDGTDYLVAWTTFTNPHQMVVMKRTGDTTFTIIPVNMNGGSMSSSATACYFHPNAEFFVMQNTTVLHFFWRQGDGTYTRSTSTVTLAGTGLNGMQGAISGDGQYVWAWDFSGSSAYVRLLKRTTPTGQTFSVVSSYMGPASINPRMCTLSADGLMLAVGWGTTGTNDAVSLLQRVGDTVSLLGKPSLGAAPDSQGVIRVTLSGAPDNDKYLSVGLSGVNTTNGIYTFRITRAPFSAAIVSPSLLNVTGITTPGTSPYGLAYHPDGSWLAYYCTGSGGTNKLFRTGATGASVPESKLTLNAVTLPTTCDRVYVLDEFAQTSGTGMHRKYEVSLNGGVNWDTVQEGEIGTIKVLNHSGTSMILRPVIYHNTGDTSQCKLSWCIAFATN